MRSGRDSGPTASAHNLGVAGGGLGALAAEPPPNAQQTHADPHGRQRQEAVSETHVMRSCCGSGSEDSRAQRGGFS
jgi:hypothetical protein